MKKHPWPGLNVGHAYQLDSCGSPDRITQKLYIAFFAKYLGAGCPRHRRESTDEQLSNKLC